MGTCALHVRFASRSRAAAFPPDHVAALLFVQLVLTTYMFLLLLSLGSILVFYIVSRPQKQKEAEVRRPCCR